MPKKAKSSKKTLIFLSLFIIAIVVFSMFLFRPVETPKNVYEVTVGEGNEKATVRLNFQSAYVMSLTGYVAEWQDASGNTISQITWSVTVTLTDVSNMQYDSQQTSYVKIKVTGSGKSKIYQINLSWQTSTKATGSLTKNIDTFLSEIGVTIDEGESVTFSNYLYEAKIYLKGTISGNGYTVSIGEQTSSFGSFTIKKPLTSPTITQITHEGTDVTSKLTDDSRSTYVRVTGSQSNYLTIYMELYIYCEGDWSNVRLDFDIKVYGRYDYTPISSHTVKFYIDGSQKASWSLSNDQWATKSYSGDLSSNAGDGCFKIRFQTSYSYYGKTITLELYCAKIAVTNLSASIIDYLMRVDIQVALVIAVIITVAIFVRRKKVKRYARRH